MTTFHVSSTNYEPGTVVNSNDYIIVTKERGNEWVEHLLDKFRPESMPSRLKCVYTFQDIEQALIYGTTLNKEVNYYQVEIPDITLKCPMVLCEFIRKSQGKNQSYLRSLCEEYWTPKQDWQFFELLSDQFVVIERLQISDWSPKFMGEARYQGDKERAKYHFKKR